MDPLEDALKALDVGIDLRQVTLLSREDAKGIASKLPGPGSIELSHTAKFKVLERTSDRIRFEVEAPADGIVNYLENYHPAFKAEIDGKPQKIIRTYGAFNGIFVPKGTHMVILTYDPLSFKIALALFGGACAALLGVGLFQIQKLFKIVF